MPPRLRCDSAAATPPPALPPVATRAFTVHATLHNSNPVRPGLLQHREWIALRWRRHLSPSSQLTDECDSQNCWREIRYGIEEIASQKEYLIRYEYRIQYA